MRMPRGEVAGAISAASRQLVDHAIRCLGGDSRDVNEQNAQAVGFYQHLGFEVTGAPLMANKPYPLLHMALAAG